MSSSSILNSLIVKSQSSLDYKKYSLMLSDLRDLGENNMKAFIYYEGLEVYCNEDRKRYEWRETKEGDEGGLIPDGFTYPANAVSFGVDYSGRNFNFYEVEWHKLKGIIDQDKEDTDEALGSIIEEMSDVSDRVQALDHLTDAAFADGIVTEAEARAIREMIRQLEIEKRDIESKYVALYYNQYLLAAERDELRLAWTSYDRTHNNLISEIEHTILDLKASPSERDAVDQRFEQYAVALAELTDAFEEAQDRITKNKADGALYDAMEYTDLQVSLVNIEIEEVNTALDELEFVKDQAFADGIVDKAEAKSIADQIFSLNKEYKDLESQYNHLITYSILEDEDKQGVITAWNEYSAVHASLSDSITQVMNDGVIMAGERVSINEEFEQYGLLLGNLQNEFKKAFDLMEQIRIDNIEVGGRNLLRNSDNTHISSKHILADYEVTEPISAGKNISISLKGVLGEGKTHYTIYHNEVSEVGKLIELSTPDEDGIYKTTFALEGAILEGDTLFLCASPDTVVIESSVEWIKLERGTKVTDWTPSPEDIKTEMEDLSQSITDLDTTIHGAFRDGIIDEAETNKINEALEDMELEKGDVDSRYTPIYVNILLTDEERLSLDGKKDAFDDAYTGIMEFVPMAIKDGIISEADRIVVFGYLNDYKVALIDLQKEVDLCLEKIEERRIGDAAQKTLADATSVAAQKALQERLIAEAHADDRITTTEEELLILADQSVEAAYRVSEAKAELAETNAKVWSDGKLTEKEAALLADAKAKFDAAMDHANGIKGDLEVLIGQAREEAELARAEAENAVTTSNFANNRTNFLGDTVIDGNNIATGTLLFGSTSPRGGITGVTDTDNEGESVRIWLETGFDDRYSAPFRATADGSVFMNKAVIESVSGLGGSIRIHDGMIECFDPNGKKRLVLGANEELPVITGYNEDEEITMKYGPNGIYYPNEIPASWQQWDITMLPISSSITNAQVKSYFENNAYVTGPIASSGGNHYYNAMFSSNTRYKYDAGTNPTSEQNSQYTDIWFQSQDLTSNDIGTGWMFKKPGTGSIRIYNRSSYYVNMKLYRIENGKETGLTFDARFTINPESLT